MSNTFCDDLYNMKNNFPPGTPTLPGFCSIKQPWILPAVSKKSNLITPVFQIPKKYVPAGLKEQYIFVGGVGASAYGLTQSDISPNTIAGVLNVAYDVNDTPELQGTHIISEQGITCFPSLLSKIGLVDGNENKMMTLVSAIYMADQLLNFPSLSEQSNETTTNPGDPMVNLYQQGNLLIHCHDGGSRSVTITALYIYYKFFIGEYTFQEVYQQVICARYLEASNHVPTQGICENAYEVLTTFKELFPKPVYN